MAKICVEKGGYYFYGNGSGGVAGNGTTSNFPTWTEINGNYKDIQTGPVNVYGIKPDNTLWAWGCGANNMLGNGSTAPASSPIQIPGEWCYVRVGPINVFGKKTDGTFWGWGNQGSLNLAVGCTTSFGNLLSTPIPFNENFTNITHISQSVNLTAIANGLNNYIWGTGTCAATGMCTCTNVLTPTIPCVNHTLYVGDRGGFTFLNSNGWGLARFGHWGGCSCITGGVRNCATKQDNSGFGSQCASIMKISCSSTLFMKFTPSGSTLLHFGFRGFNLAGACCTSPSLYYSNACNANALNSLYPEYCFSAAGVISRASCSNWVCVFGRDPYTGACGFITTINFPKPILQIGAGSGFYIARTNSVAGEFNKNDNTGTWTLNKAYQQKINDTWSDFIPTIDD